MVRVSKHSPTTINSVAHVLKANPNWSHARCAKHVGLTLGQFNGIVHRNNLYRPHRHIAWNPMPKTREQALKLKEYV